MDRTLLGFAAVLAGFAGLVNSWVALRRARVEGSADCEERLHTARAEAESAQIHLRSLQGP